MSDITLREVLLADSYQQEIDRLQAELAAAQAENAQFREALLEVGEMACPMKDNPRGKCDRSDEYPACGSHPAACIITLLEMSLDGARAWGEMLEAVKNAAAKCIKEVDLFDDFEGAKDSPAIIALRNALREAGEV